MCKGLEAEALGSTEQLGKVNARVEMAVLGSPGAESHQPSIPAIRGAAGKRLLPRGSKREHRTCPLCGHSKENGQQRFHGETPEQLQGSRAGEQCPTASLKGAGQGSRHLHRAQRNSFYINIQNTRH
jgi:hypothetical protein